MAFRQSETATYLVEGAAFSVELLQTCFADCVATAEAHRASVSVELGQTYWTGEELCPLWSLDRHDDDSLVMWPACCSAHQLLAAHDSPTHSGRV